MAVLGSYLQKIFVHMQVFDQLAVDQNNAFAFFLRFSVGVDDTLGPSDVFFRRGEDLICHLNGFRVDQGFAVKAQFCPLPTSGFAAFVVSEVDTGGSLTVINTATLEIVDELGGRAISPGRIVLCRFADDGIESRWDLVVDVARALDVSARCV